MLPQNLAALAADPLDQIALGTIAGASYYEMHFVVRIADGRTSVVGRASDWPVISRDARIAELESLLAATQQQAAEAERHAAELAAQLAVHEETAPAAAPAEPAPPPVDEAAATGAHICPECGASFAYPQVLGGHRAKKHGYRAPKRAPAPAEPPPTPARPIVVPIRPEPIAEPPFVCAECGRSEFARSVRRPTLCIRCNAQADAEAPVNGHAVAA